MVLSRLTAFVLRAFVDSSTSRNMGQVAIRWRAVLTSSNRLGKACLCSSIHNENLKGISMLKCVKKLMFKYKTTYCYHRIDNDIANNCGKVVHGLAENEQNIINVCG